MYSSNYYNFITFYDKINTFILKNSNNKYFLDILNKSVVFYSICKNYKYMTVKNEKKALKSVLELNSIYLAVKDQISSPAKRNELLRLINKPNKDLKIVKLSDDKKSFLNLRFLFIKDSHSLKMNNYSVFFDFVHLKIGNQGFKVLAYSVVGFDAIDTYLIHSFKNNNVLVQILDLKSNLDSKIDFTARDKSILAKLKENRWISPNEDLEDLITKTASLEADIEAIEAELACIQAKKTEKRVNKQKIPLVQFLSRSENREALDKAITVCKQPFYPKKHKANGKEVKLNKKLSKLETEHYYASKQLKKTVKQDLRESEFKTYLLSQTTTYKDLSLYERDLLE